MNRTMNNCLLLIHKIYGYFMRKCGYCELLCDCNCIVIEIKHTLTELNVKRVWTNNEFRIKFEMNNCVLLINKIICRFLCCFGDNSFSLDFDHTSSSPSSQYTIHIFLFVAIINYWKWKLFGSLFVGDSFLFNHFEFVTKNVKMQTQCKRLCCNFSLLEFLNIYLTDL